MCENIGSCGGCCYRDINYKEQLIIKENFVKNLLSDYVDANKIEAIIPSPSELHYRNKMEFSFGDEIKDGILTLGLHKKKSFYSILSAENCELVTDDVNRVVSLCVNFFRERKISYFHKKKHCGFLRHLVIRKSFSFNNLLINLVTTYNDENNFINTGIDNESEKTLLDDFKDILLSNDINIAGIIRTKNNSLSDAVKCDGIDVLYGDINIYEEMFELRFKISPFSFFQTNTNCAKKLYEKVMEYVSIENNDSIVYDLYSGTGTITQIVSKVAKYVYGCEIISEAVDMANENILFNKIENVKFFSRDVKDLVRDVNSGNIEIKKPDFIILDPPREGVMDKALEDIIRFDVKNIVYVSCKLKSFIDDFEILKSYGYKIVKACPVDMFPYTNNVETVILMEKGM